MATKERKIVVLTGAGISAESGFSTFRGSGGLWENHRVEDVCSVEGWMRDPGRVNAFYNGLRRRLFGAVPNRAHRLLADMQAGRRGGGALTVVTQNVDDLHERAGTRGVVHLHGELLKVCSSRDKDNPLCIRTLTAAEPDVLPGQRAADGSLERPWIVFFGESVPRLEEAAALVAGADVFAVVGSSLAVYPAASLVRYVRPGAQVFIVDPEEVDVQGCPVRPVHLRMTASEGVERLCEILESEAS